MICRAWLFPLGNIAKTKTKTPMPPTRWVKLLQNIMDLFRLSTSGNIVAPVVVNPLTLSKKASIIFGISPLITKGRAPKNEINNQDKATITKPSLEKKD